MGERVRVYLGRMAGALICAGSLAAACISLLDLSVISVHMSSYVDDPMFGEQLISEAIGMLAVISMVGYVCVLLALILLWALRRVGAALLCLGIVLASMHAIAMNYAATYNAKRIMHRAPYLRLSDSSHAWTRGPATQVIPAPDDVPCELRYHTGSGTITIQPVMTQADVARVVEHLQEWGFDVTSPQPAYRIQP